MSTPAAAITGHLVDVRTAFHREAVKPGGVGRNQAMQVAGIAVQKAGVSIEKRLVEALGDLVAALAEQSVSLRASPEAGQLLGCSNDVRDLAGLVDLHLLTETATCLSDSLDAVVYDGKRLDPVESAVFINALRFARADGQRGTGLESYAELLGNLKDLASHIIGRA